MNELQRLYERVEELELELLTRGTEIGWSDGRPHAIGIVDPPHIAVEYGQDGNVTQHFVDRHGVKLTVQIPAAKAIELGWRDPENFWRREWERVVLRGATQKDRDAVYRGLTGSKENSIWNALERGFGSEDQAERTLDHRGVLDA